jgi:NDP-sugar pyrophosphorylase family protein
MRAWTERLPKALIPVAGQPFVDHQLESLALQGVTSVVYCIGYRGDMVKAHIGDGERWGISVTYVDEANNLRGTAGALRLAADQAVLEPEFMVLYGDSYLPVELGPIEAAFTSQTRPALMVVFRNDGHWDRSNVIFSRGDVLLYDKQCTVRPPDMRFIDYGLSVLQLSVIQTEVRRDETADLADLFHRLSIAGMLSGYEVTSRFYEIGSEAGLADLEAYLRGRPASEQSGHVDYSTPKMGSAGRM